MQSSVVQQVKARLDSVAREHRVNILWAVESGSRAWGFPSPDSDYDCRFIYLRPIEDYLALFPPRDVIEDPPDPVFDVNGWDLAKALRLALKGNAVVLEWLTSPFVYAGDEDFRARFLALASELADRHRIGWHYIHLAYSMRKRVADADGQIRLKKLLYVLRPSMALRFLRLNPDKPIPPMRFQSLVAAADIPDSLKHEIDALIARKAETRELGTGPASPVMRAFYEKELQAAERWIDPPMGIDAARIADADHFFRDMLDLFAPRSGST